MKKIILTLTLISLVAATAEAREPTEDRRTLHAAMGQKNVIFEAPKSMCFLDETIPEQAVVLSALKARAAEEGRHVLLGVFADCYQISGLGQTEDPFPLADMGTVLWMNPYIGEKASMPKADYFDMRQENLPQHLAQDLKKYPGVTIDTEVARGDHGLMLGYTADIEVEYQDYTLSGVKGATLIHGFPVDITLLHASKNPITQKARLYGIMERLLAQQAALNNER